MSYLFKYNQRTITRDGVETPVTYTSEEYQTSQEMRSAANSHLNNIPVDWSVVDLIEQEITYYGKNQEIEKRLGSGSVIWGIVTVSRPDGSGGRSKKRTLFSRG